MGKVMTCFNKDKDVVPDIKNIEDAPEDKAYGSRKVVFDKDND